MKFFRWLASPIYADDKFSAALTRIILAFVYTDTVIKGLIWFLRWLRTDVFI